MSRRIRTIKPDVLLEDERAAGLSDAAWRLWVAARTFADDFGVFRAAPRYLAAQVWQDTGRAKKIPALLEELVAAGKIRTHEHEGQPYASITTWDTEQRIDGRSERTRLPSPGQQSRGVEPDLAADSTKPPRLSPSRGDLGKVAAHARARAVQPPEGDSDSDLGNGSGGDPDRAPAREPDPPLVIPDAFAFAFARGVTNATAHPYGRPTSRADTDRLIALVEAHCRREDGTPISDAREVCAWIEATAEAWGKVADDFTRRTGLRVAGFADWLNARGVARPGVQPAGAGAPSWSSRNPTAAIAKGPSRG